MACVQAASSKALADSVVAGFQKAGQPVEAAIFAEDLGISSACGSRRAVGALKKRLARGLTRSRRVKRLVTANPKASRLYQTGVRPQQNYGASISGVAPGQLRIMRQAAALSVRASPFPKLLPHPVKVKHETSSKNAQYVLVVVLYTSALSILPSMVFLQRCSCPDHTCQQPPVGLLTKHHDIHS